MARLNNPAEYEKLGRTVAAIYESGYLDKKQMLKMSFLKGIVSGLGGVLGATIFVSLIIWLLSFFGSVPLVGRFGDKVQNTVQRTNQSNR